ncbi:MAG: hypothetical protein AB1521_11375 [Bacteroidota bacterium]
MPAKRIILLVISSFLLIKCASNLSSVYSFDYPLSNERAYSTLSNISVKIPDGWYQIEDNEYGTISLWLVKNDLSSSLTFNLINVDDNALDGEPGDALEKVSWYNQAFVKVKYGKNFTGFQNQENFELNGKKFIAYQYFTVEKKNVRVVVFRHKEKFYELIAVSNSGLPDSELFDVQNAILTSLE